LWLVAMTNLINLIDGIDGLAGGIGLMVMALLAYLGLAGNQVYSLLAAGVAGSLVAFLRFNFPPARIYLGDGGAYFVGCLIGVLSIANAHKGTVAATLLAPLIALGLPIIDTALAIVRRGLKGLPVFRADRRHIHHRLLQSGFSRRDTVLVLYCISLVLALSAFGLLWTEGRWLPVLVGLAFLLLLLLFRGSKLGLDILSVGHVIGNSAQMRNRVRYALALGTCLELEAEQGRTLDELWQEFCAVARKLGFFRVKLVLPHGHRVWESAGALDAAPQPDHVYEFNPGIKMLVQFQADATTMPAMELEQLSELAAESWLKAVNRWRKDARGSVQFDPATEPSSLEAAFAGGPGPVEPDSPAVPASGWTTSKAGAALEHFPVAKHANTLPSEARTSLRA
jgi:UDP-GlcNAc:undecaprenyl-phosphate GlcNAc-1-phosphate transferase